MPAISKAKITETFENLTYPILMRKEINQIIATSGNTWRIRKNRNDSGQIPIDSFSQTRILEALILHTDLIEVNLPFPYRESKRYTWGEQDIHEIIQSIDTAGYFSHYSAMELHGITEQTSKTLFFNVEQPAFGGGGILTQEGITRAFSRKCRVSNNVITLGNYRVCKLNGQNTARLGVMRCPNEERNIFMTDLERTLIDAVVRPIYSGGVGEVANAYDEAAQISVDRVVEYLRALNYTYPYHQAIGYYLERTGKYKNSELEKLRSLPISFDFFLTYQLKNPDYIKPWRLFVPKGF